MKSLSFLFFILIFIVACNSFNLDSNNNRDRGLIDKAKGVPIIEREKLDIDKSELIETVRENCGNYLASGSLSFIPNSPLQIVRNCIAKAIDQGLKPVCENEKTLKEAKDYYLDEGDDEKVEEIEELLQSNDDLKYEFADYIYDLADSFDDLHEDAQTKIDEEKKEASGLGGKTALFVLGFIADSELGSFTRTVDFQAKTACHDNFDIKKFKKRRK